MSPDPHEPLRDDVRLLGELLGDMLRERDAALFERVEQVRAIAKRAGAGVDAEFDRLAQLLHELPLDAAVPIARAFAHFLTLANIAEQHHRVRRRRDYARTAERPQPGSCDEVFARLRAEGVSADRLAATIAQLRIELVFTAHPTEIVRRTLQQAQRRIADTLAVRDRDDLTKDEAAQSLDALRREIAVMWQTDEMRPGPVSPLDEVRAGLIAFEATVWDAVPRYLRALDRAMREATALALPLDAAPMRFGSWIGGDRDGNPSVTPDVTRQATWLARWTAADLYLRDVQALRAELSLTTASDELRSRVPDAHEPYRAILRDVVARLHATRERAAEQSRSSEQRYENESGGPARPLPYDDVADLLEPFLLCHRSLVETGNTLIAGGALTDMLRRVAAFGLTLARLDLRQEAARHGAAVDWIAREWQLGPYAEAAESDRIAMLTQAMSEPARSLKDLPLDSASAEVRDVIETFQMAAALHPDSLGAWVITMASQASDVLAVEWLQRLAGARVPQRVVPLFETAGDLAHAGAILDALFAAPGYLARARHTQEVMVGYSDSAKDAGRFAAAWDLYRAQEQIVAACQRHHVELTLFHGRGGSIGRGGGPTYLAIQSQPPGTVNARLRVTEQGEVIQAKFSLPDIAVRTLEVYTTATLEATLRPSPSPDSEWRAAMDRMADDARAEYRTVIYEQPRFVEYFRTATPEPELRGIHVGSRPASRARGGGVESLRAIPWQFAWTQTRLLLASWLGVEGAIEPALARGDQQRLHAMYDRWPFFRSTLDLIEMVLAKTDDRIAAEYDRRLVPAELQPLGADLRSKLERATAAVLAVTRHRRLVETNTVLRRAIDVRNPYVDPINLVQIELLDRMRRRNVSAEALQHAFIVTVNGIAAGMRNTG